MILVAFRSRLAPEAIADYAEMAPRMSALARTMPGYIAHKGFTSDDGERLTLVEFESEAGMRAWATNLEHVQAKKQGRKRFFTEYRVQIAQVIRDSQFQRDGQRESAASTSSLVGQG